MLIDDIRLVVSREEYRLLLRALHGQLREEERGPAAELAFALTDRMLDSSHRPEPVKEPSPPEPEVLTVPEKVTPPPASISSGFYTGKVEPPPLYLGKGEPPPPGKYKRRYGVAHEIIKQGPFQGLSPFSVVTCIHCNTKSRVYRAMNLGWPEVSRCNACRQETAPPGPPPPEPLPETPPEPSQKPKYRPVPPQSRSLIGSGPLEGIPAQKTLVCKHCKKKLPAHVARREAWVAPDTCHLCRSLWTCATCGAQKKKNNRYEESWPLPDMCAACARKTEPIPPAHETPSTVEPMDPVEKNGSLPLEMTEETTEDGTAKGITWGPSHDTSVPPVMTDAEAVTRQEYFYSKGPNPLSKKRPPELLKRQDRKAKRHFQSQKPMGFLPEYVHGGPLDGVHKGERLLCRTCGMKEKAGSACLTGWTAKDRCGLCSRKTT